MWGEFIFEVISSSANIYRFKHAQTPIHEMVSVSCLGPAHSNIL